MTNPMKKESENPALNNLGKRKDHESFLKAMASKYDLAQYRSKSNEERKDRLADFLQDWYYVKFVCALIYDAFYNVIRSSYRARPTEAFIPTLIEIREWYKEAKKTKVSPNQTLNNTVNGFSILGISGIGKSSLVKRVLHTGFKQICKLENTTQLQFIITNCVDTGSLKDILNKFIVGIDELIGTSYHKIYIASKKYTTESLTAIVANLCHLHCVGVWVIDEINHLTNVPFKSRGQIIAFLKNLSNKINIPIVLVGTPEAYTLLAENFQIARRSQGIKSFFLEKYENDADWKNLMKSIWKRTVVRKNGPLTAEIINLYFKYTQGIISQVVALHHNCQVTAIERGVEKITIEIVQKEGEEMLLTEKGIRALERNNPEELKYYADLSMQTIIRVNKLIENAETPEELAKGIFSEDIPYADKKKIAAATLRALDLPKRNSKSRSALPKPKKKFPAKKGVKKSAEENYKELKSRGLITKLKDELGNG